MNTANIEINPDDLEAAGIPPKHADAIAQKISLEIARAVRPGTGPSAITILATAAVLGFVLLTSVSGWPLIDASQERTGIRSALEANRNRIDAVNERLSTFETGVSERLTRIETLLEERLPDRQ